MSPPILPGTSTLTTRLVLVHVRQVGGEDAVARVLTASGLTGQRALLEAGRGSVGYDVKLRLFDAAARELDDPQMGRRLGAVALRDAASAPLAVLVRSLGSPALVLRNVGRISTRFETGAVMAPEHVSAGVALLSWTVLPPRSPSQVDCDYNIGLLQQVPVLFGLPEGDVRQLSCQLWGDAQCHYLVRWRHRRRWRPRRAAAHAPSHPDEMAALTTQIQSLRETATDLVGGHSTTETLDRIATRAGHAVRARGTPWRSAWPTGHATSATSASPTRSPTPSSPSWPAARAATRCGGGPSSRSACAPRCRTTARWRPWPAPGRGSSRRTTTSWPPTPRHAAAALDSAAAVDRAHAQEETARRLLDVARRLAQRRTIPEVCRSVADAVPALTGADRSVVTLWDEARQQLRIEAFRGWPAHLWGKLEQTLTSPTDSPELATSLRDRRPLLIGPGGSPWAVQLLADFEMRALVAMPIMMDEAFLGIIVANWSDTTPPEALTDTLVERLEGLAGQAAVALENARLLDEIHHQANHDPVTGLPNRLHLQRQLPDAIARAVRAGSGVALLFCDLDRFKRVNDTLGHAAGDLLLGHVAQRLRAAIRSGDTVVRFSGDEFVVLMPDVSGSEEPLAVADRIRHALLAPVVLGDEQVFTRASIGIATTDGTTVGDDPVADPEDAATRLLALADERMYRAKRQRDGIAVDRQRTAGLLRLETDLHRAVRHRELRVQFQPQIDLAGGRIAGVEALVRWLHPSRGLISPAEFIPLAEEAGMITDIGSFVLREACNAAAAWERAGMAIEVSANVSPIELDAAGYAAAVAAVIQESGIHPSRLTLEITETHAVGQAPGARAALGRLRSLGIGVSVDDFGTGYASLSQLRTLPATEVKIDRAFVAELDGTARSETFVAGVIGLARGMGLRVVAEGVETRAQLEALTRLGCHRAQGFLLGRPADADHVVALLRAAHVAAQTRSSPLPPAGS